MLSFLGIGAQKAGTTWLYEHASRHPQLAFPLGKEAHFWDRPHDAAAIAAYLKHFQTDGVAGEITPSYAALPSETVREIYACNPRMRLIYLLRNPMDRAWSSALMALQRAQMTLDEASDAWFSDHFHSAASLKRGDYQTCMETWRAVFPEQQLLILRFEQIVNEPETLLNRCFIYLQVAPMEPDQLRRQGCRQPVFTGPGYPLRPSLKPILKRLYQDKIEKLGLYLDMDLSDWLKP
ncbi:MAG TPA: sulfotransferase [Candidatus Competibacter sp.]|nr:sulfotransferase [Candidatus Competibacter sp.]